MGKLITPPRVAAVVAIGAAVTLMIVRSEAPEQTPPAEMVQTSSMWQGDMIEGGTTTFTINVDRAKFQLNLALVTWPVDAKAFEQWRDHRVDAANTFPVRIWRTRDGLTTRVETLRMQFRPGRMTQFPLGAAYQDGDLIDVEYLPPIAYVHLSSVDGKSGDQTPIPSTQGRINHPMAGDAGRRP